ncbi:MAG: hypothetical protein ACLFVT_04650 [Syntrophobacteria bacterium]
MTLKCPHCGEDTGAQRCPTCYRSLPEGSCYCCWCGAKLGEVQEGTEPEQERTSDEQEEPVDFSRRLLCSDGTCIGVIGPDGRCKECGKPYTGEPQES